MKRPRYQYYVCYDTEWQAKKAACSDAIIMQDEILAVYKLDHETSMLWRRYICTPNESVYGPDIGVRQDPQCVEATREEANAVCRMWHESKLKAAKNS